MRIAKPLLVGVIAVALAAHTTWSQTPSAPIWEYRGFRCDVSEIERTELADEVNAAVREQVDIVCGVGLPPRILGFFRTVPLKVVGSRQSNPGQLVESKMVEMSLSIVAHHHRPVLLHELLHAFHAKELKGGVRNEEIRTYYQRAKDKEVYAVKSHMMANVQEFFACSATTYLVGFTGQEPFLRDKLRSNQPRFFEHLKNIFGPDAGSYEGSREGPDLKRLERLKKPNKSPEPTPTVDTSPAAQEPRRP
jgi:hypothetical protein